MRARLAIPKKVKKRDTYTLSAAAAAATDTIAPKQSRSHTQATLKVQFRWLYRERFYRPIGNKVPASKITVRGFSLYNATLCSCDSVIRRVRRGGGRERDNEKCAEKRDARIIYFSVKIFLFFFLPKNISLRHTEHPGGADII